MELDEYFIYLESGIENAIRETLQDVARTAEEQVRDNLPRYRVLTKAAVRARVNKRSNGYRLTCRLHFSRKYRVKKSTSSWRVFREAWRQSRPTILRTFETELNQRLKRI